MKVCSKCGNRALRATEVRSRKTDGAVRIRRKCLKCDHGETTYEITQESLYDYIEQSKQLNAILRALGVKSTTPSLTCSNCVYWSNESCSMQYPEAGGKFAFECSLFEHNKH